MMTIWKSGRKIPELTQSTHLDQAFVTRIKRFVLVGVAAAAVNLAAMVLFVEVFHFETYSLKNIANIISIELSVIFNFLCNRCWTWKSSTRMRGKALIAQFVSFNLAAMAGTALRAVTFAVFEVIGVHYIMNVTIGIALAAGLSFVLYDRVVFRGRSEPAVNGTQA